MCYPTGCIQDEFSALVQQWNVQRSQALERALSKILYPQMEKELRLKLIAEAKEGILKVIQLQSKLVVFVVNTITVQLNVD